MTTLDSWSIHCLPMLVISFSFKNHPICFKEFHKLQVVTTQSTTTAEVKLSSNLQEL